MDYAGWVTPFLAFAALYIALGAIIVRNHYPRGAVAMGIAMFLIAIWFLGAAGEMAFVADRVRFLLVRDFKYIAVMGLPLAFDVFLLGYLYDRRVPGKALAALLAVPAVSLVLVWTNPLHALMWDRLHLGADAVPLPRPNWGPWFRYVFAPYNYALLGAGLVLLAAELVRGSRLRRAQSAVLLLGAVVPTVANVVYTLGPLETDLQTTPIALGFTAIVLGGGIFRFRLFQLNPVVLRTAFDAVAEALLLIDHEGRVAAANTHARRSFGLEPATTLGRPIEEVVATHGLPPVLGAREPTRTEVSLADGRYLLVEVSRVSDRRGGTRGYVVVARDMTERRRAEDAVRESEALIRGVVEHSPNGILRLQPLVTEHDRIRDFVCTFANPAARRSLGPDIDIQGRRITEIDPPHIAVLLDLFRRVVKTGRTQEVRIQVSGDPDDSRWFRVVAKPILDDIAVTFVDVTEETRRELEIEAVAYEDPLTGLLNRRGFEQDAGALLRERAGAPARPAALLYIDLDRFKQVNDTHGHAVGDAVLREVAARLRDCLRPDDLLARFGGDEFVALLVDGSRAAAEHLARRIVDRVAKPIPAGNEPVTLGASVGIVLGAAGPQRLDTLLPSADAAMYRAKAAGGGFAWAREG